LDWLKTRQLKRRILFQIGEKALYQNPVGLVTTTMMTLPGALGGKQLLRLFGFGYTPVELLANPATALATAAQGTPVLSQIAKLPRHLCEIFLLKGYEDGTRLLK
jgi:hypothetical protein